MAASIRAIQAAIAAVNVVIFALVFTSIWPFPSGDFNIDLPSAGEVTWTYEEGVVTVSAPYTIDNGGFYDVEDLTLSYDVTNYTDVQMHSGTVDMGTLEAGEVTSDTIDFTFPLLEFYESGNTWMVFNDDFLNFRVEVSCYYTMRLVHFYAEYSVSVPWEALIQEAELDDVTSDGSQLLVEYHVATSEVLSGSASVTARLYNGSLLVAEDTDSLALGGIHSGEFVFALPLTSVPDRMVVEVQAYEFTSTETFTFDPGWLS